MLKVNSYFNNFNFKFTSGILKKTPYVFSDQIFFRNVCFENKHF